MTAMAGIAAPAANAATPNDAQPQYQTGPTAVGSAVDLSILTNAFTDLQASVDSISPEIERLVASTTNQSSPQAPAVPAA
jgi:hypothetical protein